MATVSLNSCKFCGQEDTPNVTLKVCSGCEVTWYCSREHQEYDWKRHKLMCRTRSRKSSEGSRSSTSAEEPVTIALAPAVTDIPLPISSYFGASGIPYPSVTQISPVLGKNPTHIDPTLYRAMLETLASQQSQPPQRSDSHPIMFHSMSPSAPVDLTHEQLLLLQQGALQPPVVSSSVGAQRLPAKLLDPTIPSSSLLPAYSITSASYPGLAIPSSQSLGALRGSPYSHPANPRSLPAMTIAPSPSDLFRTHSVSSSTGPPLLTTPLKMSSVGPPELLSEEHFLKPKPVIQRPLFYVPRLEHQTSIEEEPPTSVSLPPPTLYSADPTPKVPSQSRSLPAFRMPSTPSSRNLKLHADLLVEKEEASEKSPRIPSKSFNASQELPVESSETEVTKFDHSQNRPYSVTLTQHLAKMTRLQPTMSRYDAFCMRIEEISRASLNSLVKYGWAVVDGLLGDPHCSAILEDIKKLYSLREFDGGKLMKSRSDRKSDEIRSDKIYWFDNRADKNADFVNLTFLLGILDSIVGNYSENLMETKINGRSRAMVACYPGAGARYVRHVDNPVQDGRLLTCIYYTNRDWTKEHGGVLRLFPVTSLDPVEVEPVFDRFLVFWSDKRNPHEVLPSFHNRFAVTVWYFDELEKARAQLRSDIKKPTYRNLSSSELAQMKPSESYPSNNGVTDPSRRRGHGVISKDLAGAVSAPVLQVASSRSLGKFLTNESVSSGSSGSNASMDKSAPMLVYPSVNSEPVAKQTRRNKFMMGESTESDRGVEETSGSGHSEPCMSTEYTVTPSVILPLN